MSNNWISSSEIGDDIIGMSESDTRAELTVGEWLKKDTKNLVIRYGTTNFLFNKETLDRQSREPRASLVKCPDQTVQISDKSPTTYMDLRLIAIPGVVVETIDVMDIIKNNHQVYEIIPASTIVPTNAEKINNGASKLLALIQSTAPTYIRVVVQNDENTTENCKSSGEYFYNKIVKINLKNDDLELPAPRQETNMPPTPPSGGKRKITKKRKRAKKRKSSKKRKSAKKK